MSHNVLILHDFGIYPEFRSKGIGEATLKGLINLYREKCGYIVLNSFPKQLEEDGVFGENKWRRDMRSLDGLDTGMTIRIRLPVGRCGGWTRGDAVRRMKK